MLIADRFLPDRSINIISQRYSKLSLLLFKAHGIKIDDEGNLAKPPKLDSVDKADVGLLATLKRVDPPAILNVHRWSIEEDLTLLRAVPVLGHMWAELSSRLMPHRDRGHLRKRYQVLERRIKATVSRSQKDTPRPSKKEVKAPPHFLKKRASASTKSVSETLSSRVARRPSSVSKSPQKAAQQYNPSLSTRNGYGPYDDFRYHPPHHHSHPPPRPMPPAHHPYRDRYPPHPYQYYQQYNTERLESSTDASRFGVEQILRDSNTNDDSYLTNVQEMMKNHDNEKSLESEVVNTISNLSKKDEKRHFIAPRTALDRGLQKVHQTDASNQSNGLDMLAANAREGESPVKSTRGSILNSVLERAGRQDYDGNETAKKPGTPRKPGTPLTSPVPKIGYSPAASFSLHMSPPGGSTFLFPNNSEDGFAFDISDRSRQMLGTPSKLPSLEPNSTLEDLDAASALNSLSNSPARFSNAVSKDTSGVKRSLFDRVIKKTGDEKNKKQKL